SRGHQAAGRSRIRTPGGGERFVFLHAQENRSGGAGHARHRRDRRCSGVGNQFSVLSPWFSVLGFQLQVAPSSTISPSSFASRRPERYPCRKFDSTVKRLAEN